jgi:gluconolactonase
MKTKYSSNLLKNYEKYQLILIACFIGLAYNILLNTVLAQSPIPAGATPVVIVTGIQQPEGPVWKDGIGLLFSDIKDNKIYKWTQAGGKQIYLNPSDSSNGLTLDLQGRLILTQMRPRRISRQETDSTITVLASTYNGKKFNSPNDVVVKSSGSIFFTDPNYNIPYPYDKELGFQGIYRISPSGSLLLLDKTLNEPNGICFSLDEKKLYVDDSNNGTIYVWDVINDSTIANKTKFYQIPNNGGVDGMKIDPSGNIYCAGSNAVYIISPKGVYIDKIVMPAGVTTSNCAWGNADRKTLFITGGSSVYMISLNITDVKSPDNKTGLNNSFELFPNYPNPFNPSTKIRYSLSKSSDVKLSIFSILGQEVATIVNKYQPSGSYEETFNAGKLASGTYIYRLDAGGYSVSNKMVYEK